MKKIAFALAFILTASAGFSQQRKRMGKADMMTPEQRATLTVKRMALQLDLTKDQTQKITALYTEMGTQRKVKGDQMRKDALASRAKLAKIKKESKDKADFKERMGRAIKSGELKKEDVKRMRRRVDFDTANTALDNRIEFQAKMKKILNPEQYEKFTKLQKRKIGKAKKKMASKMKNKKMRKRGKEKHQK
jgi:protein CpxP